MERTGRRERRLSEGGAEKGQRGEGSENERRGGVEKGRKMRGGLTGNMGRVERVYIRLYKRYAREEKREFEKTE